MFLRVDFPVLSLLVPPPSRSNTLNLMLWLPNKVIRLERPYDSEASQHMDVSQSVCYWPMTEYESIIGIGPKL